MLKKHGGVALAGVILVFVGAIICGVSVFAMGFDFGRFANEKYEVNQIDVTQDFSNVRILCGIEDVEFALSNDGRCQVTCQEREGLTHTVKVENDTLVVETKDEREWYQKFVLWTNSSKITVMLPEASLGQITVDANTSDIKVPEGFTFETLQVNVNTGDVEIEGLNVTGDVQIKTSTGDVKLKKVIARGKLETITSTGDVKFQECDGATVYVKTSTGDVGGSLLSDKVFSVKTSTGDVDVPQSGAGGKCEITTSTGDVRIVIK